MDPSSPRDAKIDVVSRCSSELRMSSSLPFIKSQPRKVCLGILFEKYAALSILPRPHKFLLLHIDYIFGLL